MKNGVLLFGWLWIKYRLNPRSLKIRTIFASELCTHRNGFRKIYTFNIIPNESITYKKGGSSISIIIEETSWKKTIHTNLFFLINFFSIHSLKRVKYNNGPN